MSRELARQPYQPLFRALARGTALAVSIFLLLAEDGDGLITEDGDMLILES